PPTIYFPLIVDEAFMIEPTEGESKETIDKFAEAMEKIMHEDVAILKNAPHKMPVKRVNEVKAAKDMLLTWKDLKCAD
ncbi:MAG: aminomethyl-transferring glycine dehydrogenase subunit GcvPB, partial [Thermoplasmata archaeon]